MPYITQEDRKVINKYLNPLLEVIDGCDEGDLNYIITMIIHKWLKEMDLKYRNINTVIGILECAKMELYRMVAAPYEDKKIKDNDFISELDKGVMFEKRYYCKKCKNKFDQPDRTICSSHTYYTCPDCGSSDYLKEEEE